ncbi:hypothetical protein KAI46_10155 [bacterium]|nr:hypothetical protein [bacterium]
MAEITETIGFDNVDLINLNKASTVLAFEALNGTVICLFQYKSSVNFLRVSVSPGVSSKTSINI